MVNLLLVFTENQHLVEISPYESFIPTYQKRGLLYTLLLKDFTIYESFIPAYQKRGLLYTLLHKSFSKTFLFEIDHLKTILLKNNHPPNFIDSYIKSFPNKLYTPKVIVEIVPKRNVFVKLPFFGKYFVSNSKEASKII